MESIDKAASKDKLHYNYINILIEGVQDSNVLGFLFVNQLDTT